MEAKEEAKELYKLYKSYLPSSLEPDLFKALGKKCALICVNWHIKEFTDTYGDDLIDNINYWEQVKQEIHKL